MQASGYTSQGTLTLLVNAENSFKVSVAEYIAASFTAAGVPTEAKVLPWEEYLSALSSGEFDFYYGEVRLGADWDLTALLSTGGSLNYGGWSDETTDALLSASLASENRESALRQLCMHLQESSPIFPVCFKLSSVLTQSGVFQGLQSTAAEPFYSLSSCTVTLRASTAEE